MRRYPSLFLYLSLVLCYFFFSCSGKKTSDIYVTPPQEENAQRETAAPTTVHSLERIEPQESQQVVEDFSFDGKKDKVLFVFIRPSNFFIKEQEKIYIDGSTKLRTTGRDIIAFYVEPGRQYLFFQTATTPGIKAKFKAGNTYYFYNPDDAKSQVTLGNLLYEKENFKGAIGAYRLAAKLDSSLTDFYKQYAEIVIKHGKVDEIERVMKRLISIGQAGPTTFLGLGKVYQKRKQYSQAMIQYEKCLQQEPENGEAMLALAGCKALTGETQEAIALFEKAIRLNPSSPGEYKTLGDLYKRQKEPSKAMQAYKAFLDKGGKNSIIASEVGTQAYNRRNYKEAAKYLAMVKGKKARSANHLIKMSESYYHSEEYGKAIPKFKAAMKLGLKVQRKKQIMLLLARSYEKTNAGKKALYWYDQFAKLAKTTGPEVSYKRAFLREKSKRAEAIKMYEKNITRFPKDYRNFLRLGIVYSKRNTTLSKSASMLKTATRLADTVSAAWIEIAQVYGKLNRSNDELAAYKKYLSFNKDNIDANARVGTLLIKKGKISEGLPYLQNAYTKKPNDVPVLISLATAYRKNGNNGEALELLLKAKKLNPKIVEVRKSISEIYKNMGQTTEAMNEMKELIETQPDNAARIHYAKMLQQEGKLDDAINTIEDIRAVDPENIEALMVLGQILQEQGKLNEALETYKEISFIDPDNAHAICGQADVYLAQEKVLWAEKYYKKALAKNARLGLAVFGLAKAAKVRKNEKLYQQYLSKAYRLSPNQPEIKEAYNK